MDLMLPSDALGQPGWTHTSTLCRRPRIDPAGVQSEIEFAFAGLHQLCLPLLDRLERLPAPQCEALATAFGLRAGTPPDRFFVGLAVLTLRSEAAEEQPLVCLVDDVQWLDRASALVARWSAVGVDRRADPRPGRRRAALRELDHPPSLAEVDVTGPGDGAVAVVGISRPRGVVRGA